VYDEFVQTIERVLEPFGYAPEHAPGGGGNGGGDDASPWRALNDMALARLDSWVSALDLYKCVRHRDGSYAAVATWRPSSTGRALEERKRNLGICSKGIKDFGTSKSYSPIDLVMAALGLDFARAADWLDERVGWSSGGPEIRFEAPGGSADAKPEEERARSDSGASEEPGAQGGPKSAGAEGKKYRFKIIDYDDIEVDDEPPYLVHGLVPLTGLVVIWGTPKCFKTFWALTLAQHVPLGWKFYGREVQQGASLYLAFEGLKGLKQRVRAFRIRNPDAAGHRAPFKLIELSGVNLVMAHKRLIEEVAEHLGAVKPRVIVLDTLNKGILPGSENKDVDMGAYIAAAEALRIRFDCVVIIIHHCGHDTSRPRGHTSLTGAVDAQLAVVRDGLNTTLRVEFMKDGPDGDEVEPLCAHLETETFKTKKGVEISAGVLIPDEGSSPDGKSKRSEQSLNTVQKLALDSLIELVAKEGAPLPPELGEGSFKGVPVERWYEELYDRGVVDRGHANPRAKCNQQRTALLGRKLIRIRGDLVWVSMGV
jgi:hypothetical protein